MRSVSSSSETAMLHRHVSTVAQSGQTKNCCGKGLSDTLIHLEEEDGGGGFQLVQSATSLLAAIKSYTLHL